MRRSVALDLIGAAMTISAFLWIFGRPDQEKNKRISRLILLIDAEEDPMKKEALKNELRAIL